MIAILFIVVAVVVSEDKEGKEKAESSDVEGVTTGIEEGDKEVKENETVSTVGFRDIEEVTIDGKSVEEFSKDLKEQIVDDVMGMYGEADMEEDLGEEAFKMYFAATSEDFIDKVEELSDKLDNLLDVGSEKEFERLKGEVGELMLEVNRGSVVLSNSWLIGGDYLEENMLSMSEADEGIFEATAYLIPIVFDGREGINTEIDIEYYILRYREELLVGMKEMEKIYEEVVLE